MSGKALEGETDELGCAAFDPNNSTRMCTAEGGQIQVRQCQSSELRHMPMSC